MGYKWNNGNLAYICDKCNVIMCTGEEAIELSNDLSDKYCEECDDNRQKEREGE